MQLTLYCDKVAQSASFAVGLHLALSEWGEPPTVDDATWRHAFYSTQFWTAQGGDFASTASESKAVGGTGDRNARSAFSPHLVSSGAAQNLRAPGA